MPVRPTRAARPPETPVLVYDGGCPFCTATALWLKRHARTPVQLLTFDDIEGKGLLTRLTDSEVVAAAHFITPRGIEYHGGEAVTRAVCLTRLRPLAAALDLPILALVRDATYALVTRLRPLLSKYIHP